MAHINHPIIGDRPHGCNKQNKLFKEKWQMDKMMLHAKELSFVQPSNDQIINICANISSEFERTLEFLSFEKLIAN
jgi:tRNA pseudouridine65 synthase